MLTESIEFGLGCEYARERKKRGKASRKDLAAKEAARAAGDALMGQKFDASGEDNNQTTDARSTRSNTATRHSLRSTRREKPSRNESIENFGDNDIRLNSTIEIEDQVHVGKDGDHIENAPTLDINDFSNIPQSFERQDLGSRMMDTRSYGSNQAHNLSTYPDLQYSISRQTPPNYEANGDFPLGHSPMVGYPIGAGATPPGWVFSFSSPTGHFGNHVPQPNYEPANPNHSGLRYPVLGPLAHHISNIIPISLACDLVELYFSSSSSAQMHPMSPYVLGFVFRKRAFLHPIKPRRCQPALLASMLWVAAQTSDASFLTSVPSARGKICQKLLELTVGLLNPLIHTPSGHPSPGASPAIDGVALGGLGVALPGTMSMESLSGETGAFGAAGNLDDVIAYIHLATVVSASEYKGASLRWWNAAWSLARELKLGRELPPSPLAMKHDPNEIETEGVDGHDVYRDNLSFVMEEEREERRRIWWLVYIVDRHLALCYNRPLFLLDIECEGLQQPLDDNTWQRGDFGAFKNTSTDSIHEGPSTDSGRARGPSYECRGHGIFGYFLPLMTILGEIVDLHHAKNHPRFGLGFRSAAEWDDQAAEITRHLEAYETSLKNFQKQHLPKHSEEKGEHHDVVINVSTPLANSVNTNTSDRLTESDIQSRIVIAYGTHVMHVLHILLAGKWDPVNLIDDNDLWISTQDFITATSHAVSAAEATSQILEFDPGLEFMPFFFGIYLLQGSFLLLLIADKLQFEASSSVVRACEIIVRAHEACVVTLNTGYQVSDHAVFSLDYS